MTNDILIDAHHHLWDRTKTEFDYRWQESAALRPICRSFIAEDLAAELTRVGVQRTVVVQTQHCLAENDWALELADRYEFIAGVVGWVDLVSPNCEAQVEQYAAHPKFVGVRHVTQDEPDDNFIVRPDVLRGLRILEKHRVPFDLLFYVKHLRHATTLAREFPELPLVIDHLAKPEIKLGKSQPWLDDFRSAAQFPNVYCKLSGMVTEADWQQWNVDDLRYYVDVALAEFGPERCMFGSDWPVCLLAASYEQVFRATSELIAQLSDSERAAVLGGTAQRFYALS
jgi:L-fuconolactonase